MLSTDVLQAASVVWGRQEGKGEHRVSTTAEQTAQDTQREAMALDPREPLFRSRNFDQPVKLKPNPGPAPSQSQAAQPSRREQPAKNFEPNTESYLRARRVAEMKFNTIKLAIAFSVVSASLLAINVFMYPGVWWCQWPVGFWTFVISFPMVKAFVFHGKDIRSVIEDRIHRMALREAGMIDRDY